LKIENLSSRFKSLFSYSVEQIRIIERFIKLNDFKNKYNTGNLTNLGISSTIWKVTEGKKK